MTIQEKTQIDILRGAQDNICQGRKRCRLTLSEAIIVVCKDDELHVRLWALSRVSIYLVRSLPGS